MLDLVEFHRHYGETVAARLTAIGHAPTAKRFVYVEDMDNYEEVIAAQTRELKPETNVLVWERFAERLGDGGRDNYNSRPQGNLAVIRKPAKDSREARTSAIDVCRQAALKAMALMRFDEQDKEGRLSQKNIRCVIDGQGGEPIPLLRNGWVGYGFTFDWLAPLDFDLYEDDLTDDDWLSV